jgi:hypothetical protein
MSIEAIDVLDDAARLREHRAIEAEGQIPERADTPVDAMTDAELVIVILHDADMATRRKALHVLRLREFTEGLRRAAAIIEGLS